MKGEGPKEGAEQVAFPPGSVLPCPPHGRCLTRTRVHTGSCTHVLSHTTNLPPAFLYKVLFFHQRVFLSSPTHSATPHPWLPQRGAWHLCVSRAPQKMAGEVRFCIDFQRDPRCALMDWIRSLPTTLSASRTEASEEAPGLGGSEMGGLSPEPSGPGEPSRTAPRGRNGVPGCGRWTVRLSLKSFHTRMRPG